MRRPCRWCSTTPDVVYLTAGDPRRRTGGNLYAARMLRAIARAGIRVRTVVLDGNTPPAIRAPLAIVDTIAATLAAPHLERLRSRGTRVIALVQMRRGGTTLARRADRVIAVGVALADELVRSGAPRSRIAVVRPGRDGISRRRRADVGAVGRERGRGVRVLCVANWTLGKGVHTLLAAVAKVPEVAIDLVGDQPDARYAARVRRLARATALRGRVRAYGSLRAAALARRYEAAAIFALPSVREGYPIAYAEALAHALPVVGCDIPAVREVTDGAAVLVPPGRIRPLTAAIERLARDPRARSELSRRAGDRARRLPTWKESERRFVRVVQSELRKALLNKPHA